MHANRGRLERERDNKETENRDSDQLCVEGWLYKMHMDDKSKHAWREKDKAKINAGS